MVGHVFSDIDVQNADGDTALHLAAEFDQPSVIETLLKHKADFHKVHHSRSSSFSREMKLNLFCNNVFPC